MNPSVYTRINRKPPTFILAARINTDARMGPMHGVQAKLKVNPIINAVIGDIVNLFMSIANLFSLVKPFDVPKRNSCIRPNIVMIIHPINIIASLWLLKNLPKAVVPRPKSIKTVHIPATKNAVLSKVFFLFILCFPSESVFMVPPERYPM